MRFKRTGLWLHGDFLKLWAGETISLFGSLVGRSALIFTAVLVLHATPLEIGVLGAAELLPDVLFGLVAGVWVDRLRRRPIMIVADIGQFAVLATIPLAYAFDALTIGQVFAVAFVAGTFHVFFYVSYWTYLPTLVEKDAILEGNSKMAGTWAVAEVAGFGVSGWLVQVLTAPVAILVDSLSFLVSAAALLRIRKPEPQPKPAEERTGVRQEIVEGGRAIIHEPVLRATAVAHALAGFSFRVYGAVYLLYATDVLGFKPGVLGMTWGVGGATSLVGAMFAGRAAARLGLGPALTLGLTGMGLLMLLFPAAHDASLIALALLVGQQFGDGFFTIWDINQVTLRQSITAEHVLGRVNAGFRFAGQGAMLAGALTGGVLGEVIGLRSTLILGSGVMLAAGAWLTVTPVWGMRTALVPATVVAGDSG
jgi:predicted MFS family arabinose efflux permease